LPMLHRRRKQWAEWLLMVGLIAVACSSPGPPEPARPAESHPIAGVAQPEPFDRASTEPPSIAQPTSQAASGPPTAQPAPTAATRPRQSARTPPLTDYAVHLPSAATARQPLTVLVALHGMGGNGTDFSRKLIEHADRRGWLLVAPTIKYRDWRNPEEVRRDGAEYLPALKGVLDDLSNQTGLTLHERVLLYGFSRGGQAAHRFAFMYPEASRGVAALSSGTYTLPKKQIQRGADEALLRFPYGVADLEQYMGKPFDPAAVRQVGFWLGVGANDNLASDLPRQWDAYIGSTRVERARAFSRALEEMGANAELRIFPNASHEVTDEMRAQAVDFLGGLPQ
jgi:predicted esterase